MYEPATRLKLIARLDELAAKGRNAAPKEVRFTTWMLRYHRMYWVDIDGMQKQWERARVNAKVDGQRVTVTTVNVSALHLDWVVRAGAGGPGHEAPAGDRRHQASTARGARRLVLERRAGQAGRQVAHRDAAGRAQQDARPARPNRRRVHGLVHDRPADRTGVQRGARRVGARAARVRDQRMARRVSRRAAREGRHGRHRRRHRRAQSRAVRRSLEQRDLQAHRREAARSSGRRPASSPAARRSPPTPTRR